MAADSGGSIKPVAVIILGADTLVAASPATPIQLWHACLASGYDLAVPATWGDELVAAETLRALGSHPETAAVMCSCPMVARVLGDADTDLSANLVSLVAPPVAAARYLRRVYGERRVHITFAGACPAAGDSAIDSWLTPTELLGRFIATGIELEQQPQLFESVLPPDRRRHLSQPGGVPTAERVAALARPRQLIEIDDADLMTSIRRHLMGGVRVLVDVAPRLGCTCSGAVEREPAGAARRAVTTLEPPRSMRPVMPDPGGLGLLRRVPPRTSPREPGRAEDRGVAPAAPGTDAHRTVATSRPASRSPLSWNLRERALPQPPTAGRTPGTSSHRVGTAGAWSSIDRALPGNGPGKVGAHPPTSTTGNAEAVSLDPTTVAAARAVEARAQARRSGESASLEARQAATAPAASEHEEVTLSPSVSDETSAPTPERPFDAADDRDSASSGSRSTPPGGYWFVAPTAAEQPDMEVRRGPPSIEPGASLDAGGPESDAVQPTATEPLGGKEVSGEAVAAAEPDGPPSTSDATPVATPDGPGSISDEVEATPGGPSSCAEPGTAGSAPSEEVRDTEPPDRGWPIATLIILLLASAMVARGVVQRRSAEPVIAVSPYSGRATADVVLVMGPGVSYRGSESIESVFVASSRMSTEVPGAIGNGGR